MTHSFRRRALLPLLFLSPVVADAAPTRPAESLVPVTLATPASLDPVAPTASARAEAARREIRVLLGRYRRVALTGTDLILNGSPLNGSAAFNVRCQNGRVEYGSGSGEASSLEVNAPGGFLQVNGKLYRHRITIFSQGSECAVVNTVDLEKYLAGLINKEMSPSWPLEAMKAQAVASRSYALFQSQANRNSDYDLESTTQDQVYDGAGSETAKSNRAAEETRGIVIAYANTPVKAYYHANCGGMTELPVAVWGSESPAFRPVVCPYHHQKRDKLRWTLTVTPEQIQAALKKVGNILPTNFRRLAMLEAGAPNPNQRLNDVMVSDTSGNSLVVSANAFRNALGNTKVRSTAFKVHEEHGSYRLDGQGFGHGVGMCQVGARAMAEEGKTFRQILRYYYPLTKLSRL